MKNPFSKIYALMFMLMAFNTMGQSPVVTSFSPASGPVGTLVTISGQFFDPAPGNNVVFFGATRAFVNTASATQLQVVVPSGGTHHNLTVTNLTTRLTGSAIRPFIATFPGGPFHAGSFAPRVDF